MMIGNLQNNNRNNNSWEIDSLEPCFPSISLFSTCHYVKGPPNKLNSSCVSGREEWRGNNLRIEVPGLLAQPKSLLLTICVIGHHLCEPRCSQMELTRWSWKSSLFHWLISHGQWGSSLSFIFLKIYLFLDGRERRKRGKETSMCGCRLHAPHWFAGRLNPLSHTSLFPLFYIFFTMKLGSITLVASLCPNIHYFLDRVLVRF